MNERKIIRMIISSSDLLGTLSTSRLHRSMSLHPVPVHETELKLLKPPSRSSPFDPSH